MVQWKALRIAVASPLIALTVVPVARGEELRVSAEATAQEEYQDNVAVSPAKESSWLTTIASEVSARYGAEQTGASVFARWEARAYSTDRDLNTVNQRYAASWQRRRERTTAGASVGLIRDTTLDSELRETGIVLSRDARWSGSAGADLGYSLSELTEATWRYRCTDTRYTGPALIDYVDHRMRWETRRALSEADQSIGVSVDATMVDAEASYRSQEWSGTASYVHPLNERDRATLTAGIRWTRVQTTVPSDAVSTDTGLVGEASLIRRWEGANLSLLVSQWTNPSGSGRLVDTTRVGLQGDYALTDRVTAMVTADWYRNTDAAPFGASVHSTFVSLEPAISSRIAERLTAAAAYTHQRQRLPADHVDANRVMVRLTYRWHPSE